MKSLKRFFMSIFILIFSSVCLVNLDTSASSLNYASGKYSGFSCSCGTGDGYFFDFKQKKKIPITLETLCNEINELTGEAIPSEINDQQIMVCKNLCLLFSKDFEKEPYYELQDVLFLLCENDPSLHWKIRPILDKCDYKDFCLLYQKLIDVLPIDKSNQNLIKADALLLLSYVYLYTEGMILEEDPIFNIDEMLNLIILLKQIFSGTIYEPILDVFLSY